MNLWELGKEFALNLGQDVGMDAANYGTGKMAQRKAIKDGIITQDIKGNLIKRDQNYNVAEVTEEDLKDLAKKAVDQNTLSSKALSKANENALLNELAKNSDLREQVINNVDDNLTDRLNFSRRTEMANAIKNGADADLNGIYMRQKAFDDANEVRKTEGKTPYESRQTKLYAERAGAEDQANYPKGHYSKHSSELGGAEGVVDTMERSINGNDAQAYPASYDNTLFASRTARKGEHPAATAVDESGGVVSISQREDGQIDKYDRQKNSSQSGRVNPTIATSEDASAGFRFSGRQATDSNIPQNTKTVDPETQARYDNLRDVLAQRKQAENAPAQIETEAERNKKYDNAIKRYYKKYGENFEEKMPSALQDRYNDLLDKAPRDKSGNYTDPITGGKTIDATVRSDEFVNELRNYYGEDTSEKYNLVESARKLSDVTSGKTSFDDYLSEQRELLWKSFKDSNRGTETFYTRDDNDQINGRHTVSENGELYRKLYSEVGSKPNKTEFNEALDDVIKNGTKSEYYNGFRELDPGGQRSAFNYNQGNEGIDMILVAKEMADNTKAQNKAKNNNLNGESDVINPLNTKIGKQIANKADELYTKVVNKGAVSRLTKALDRVQNGQTNTKDVTFARITKELLSDINAVREAQGKNLLTERNVKAFAGAINNHLTKHLDEYGSTENIAKAALDVLTRSDTLVLPGDTTRGNKGTLLANSNTKNKFIDSVVLGDTEGGETSLKSVSPRAPEQIENLSSEKESLLEGDLVGGNDTLHPIPDNRAAGFPNSARQVASDISDPIISQNGKNNKKKQSKFANETVAKSEEVSEKLQGQVKENQTSYRPTSNAEHLAKSEEFMKSKTLSQAESDITSRVINKKVGDINDQDVSDAIAVAKALDAKGDNASLERASAIYESLSKHATKKGQEIQALSLLNNRSPEGLRYGAEKAIAKGGTEITPEIHKQVMADTDRITKARSELTKAQNAHNTVSKRAKALYESGNNISDKDYQKIMTDLDASSRRLDNAKHQLDTSYGKLSKTVADQQKQSIGDIYSSIHKGGLLSAPTTHIKNITSNGTFALMNKVSDAPAAAMDKMLSLVTGKRTKTFTNRGILKGAAKGTRYGMEQMRTGIDELGGTGAKYTSGFPELRFKNKVADFIIGKPNRAIFRAMGAGDKPFRYSAQANSLYDQAIAESKSLGLSGKARDIFVKQFISDPPQAALEKSWTDGERAVLGQDNMVSKLVSGAVQGMKKSDNVATKAIGTFIDAHVVPFVKVPTNFLIETSKYTPAGEIAEAGKIINDAVHGRGFDQRAFVEATSKSGLGTAGLVALGGLLANNFTGEYPEDEKERNRWEAEGIKENAVKIGDRYIPLEAFGPASLLMGAGAQFWKSMNEGDGVLDSTTQAMAQLGRSIEDQSFLTGISNILDVVEGKTSAGSSATNYIKQEVASNVPNIVKKLADATDPLKRSTGKKSDVVSQTVAQVAYSIPFLRELLPAKVDVYGNDLKNGAFLSGFLDPTGSGYELQKGNEMVEEVARLHNIASSLDLTDDEKKELEVTPADVKYQFGAKGSEVTLSDEEQRELTKTTGQLISSTWQDTMASDQYKNADDLTKARLLANGRAAAVNLAKQQFADEHGYTAPKMTNDAKALANGTFTATAKSGSGDGKSSITISNNLSGASKSVLEKYNSMSSDDWDKYVYGDSPDAASAEYDLAKAKYDNDVAEGKLTDVQKIKRQKELDKLEVSQKWTKDVRDVYSLAGTKADVQELLGSLGDEDRATMVGRLSLVNIVLS